MEFYPDIRVRKKDGYEDRLVVGVDDDNADLAARAADIKAYMNKYSIGEGLLVSPSHFRVYRNWVGPYPDGAAEIADFPTREVMGRLPSHVGRLELWDFVEEWLRKIPAPTLFGMAPLPPKIQDVIEWEILPFLYNGEILVSGSRWVPEVY